MPGLPSNSFRECPRLV